MMVNIYSTLTFKENKNFLSENLVNQGWRELPIIASLIEKILWVFVVPVLCLLSGAGVVLIFGKLFGIASLTRFEPIFLPLIFVGLVPHELVHVLTSQKLHGKKIAVNFCSGVMGSVIAHEGSLTRSRVLFSLLAPLWMLTLVFLAAALLIPSLAGFILLLAAGNAAWSGVDLYIALFILLRVRKDQAIHLSSATKPGVFVGK
jgi:hypothetical protein